MINANGFDEGSLGGNVAGARHWCSLKPSNPQPESRNLGREKKTDKHGPVGLVTRRL